MHIDVMLTKVAEHSSESGRLDDVSLKQLPLAESQPHIRSSVNTRALAAFLLVVHQAGSFNNHVGHRARSVVRDVSPRMELDIWRALRDDPWNWLDPQLPKVGGYKYTTPVNAFPVDMQAPESVEAMARTPLPDFTDSFFAPFEGADLLAGVLLGIGLMLGPDFLLAPSGLVSNEGIRPGFNFESVIGNIVTPDEQWLKDRKEKLASEVPLKVRALVILPFLLAGLLADRLITVALDGDQTFALSFGIISVFLGSGIEIARDPLPTRAERDLNAKLRLQFSKFADKRLRTRPSGRSEDALIVEAFRELYKEYRYEDMRRTVDGTSVANRQIAELIEEWNQQMGRPGKRSTYGFWKGIELAPSETQ
jgi:hypothetical protein